MNPYIWFLTELGSLAHRLSEYCDYKISEYYASQDRAMPMILRMRKEDMGA